LAASTKQLNPQRRAAHPRHVSLEPRVWRARLKP